MFNNNVDSIIKTLTKTVSKLDAVAEREEVKAAQKKETIEKLNKECDCHSNEAVRARKIAKNVNSLIDV